MRKCALLRGACSCKRLAWLCVSQQQVYDDALLLMGSCRQPSTSTLNPSDCGGHWAPSECKGNGFEPNCSWRSPAAVLHPGAGVSIPFALFVG